MKKIILSAFSLMLLFSCSNDETTNSDTEKPVAAVLHRGCASQDVHERQLRENPLLAQKMAEIEAITQEAILTNRIVNGVLEIPVVFNVLYRTTAENISQAQLQSQIDVLNADFQGTNADYNSSNPYNSVRGAINVKFILDNVVRKSTTKTSWGTNDAMKKTASGGITT